MRVVPCVIAIKVDDTGETVRDDVKKLLPFLDDDGALTTNFELGWRCVGAFRFCFYTRAVSAVRVS